jgi:phage FluMu protein Com
MTINFRCEHCGKKVEAPDSAGGKRGRCPYCKQSNYIPAPVSDDDIIPLAPEEDQPAGDDEVRQHERALIAELAGGEEAPVPLEHRENLEPQDLYHLVVNYCVDMAESRLERAKLHLAELKKVRQVARQAVDDFLSGKALEPTLDRIPLKILQGFLNNLRNELGSP